MEDARVGKFPEEHQKVRDNYGNFFVPFWTTVAKSSIPLIIYKVNLEKKEGRFTSALRPVKNPIEVRSEGTTKGMEGGSTGATATGHVLF